MAIATRGHTRITTGVTTPIVRHAYRELEKSNYQDVIGIAGNVPDPIETFLATSLDRVLNKPELIPKMRGLIRLQEHGFPAADSISRVAVAPGEVMTAARWLVDTTFRDYYYRDVGQRIGFVNMQEVLGSGDGLVDELVSCATAREIDQVGRIAKSNDTNLIVVASELSPEAQETPAFEKIYESLAALPTSSFRVAIVEQLVVS